MNLNGRVCLYGALVFGAFSVALVLGIHPVVTRLTQAVPDGALHIVCACFALILLIDLLTTIGGMQKLNRLLRDAAHSFGHEQWFIRRLGAQQKRMLISFPALISTRYNQALQKIRQAFFQIRKKGCFMKLLMLSCNTGEGHNSAAHALAEAAQTKGHETQIVDPLSLGTDRVGEVASSIYNRMIQKVPELFGLIYRAGDLYSSTGIPSPVYRVTSRYAARLREYIAQQRIDAVISTHLYGMEVATAAKRQGGLPVPCFSVLTDYTCIPFLAETRQDLYFIPHADLKEEFIRRGIPEEKFAATASPFEPSSLIPSGRRRPGIG